MEAKEFCENCRDLTNYMIKEEYKNKVVDGEMVWCKTIVAYCNDCGSEMFIPELRDLNLKILKETYNEIKENTYGK